MAGRPKGNLDPEFAERVWRACSKPNTSFSRTARAIGVWPSTLCRSMHERRFSKELRAKLERHLEKEAASGSVERKLDDADLQEVLRLLSELGRLVPDLHRRLVVALDPQARLGQTTE